MDQLEQLASIVKFSLADLAEQATKIDPAIFASAPTVLNLLGERVAFGSRPDGVRSALDRCIRWSGCEDASSCKSAAEREHACRQDSEPQPSHGLFSLAPFVVTNLQPRVFSQDRQRDESPAERFELSDILVMVSV